MPIPVMEDGVRRWPEDWPKYARNHPAQTAGEPCDMLVGPCSCGAWHVAGEFELINGFLLRDGRLQFVATDPGAHAS
jgi:hypothetical protein